MITCDNAQYTTENSQTCGKTEKCESESREAVNKSISQDDINVGIDKEFKAAITNMTKDKEIDTFL